MGKSQEKTSSSHNLKESSSFLDFDIGKDFLDNWKPKSVGKDEVTDLDFGPVMKNKNKPFQFEKMDVDFNLDGDFGNVSSFNIDLSGFDVSSPVKKDGNPKEKPKEASEREINKGKADCFDFSFDFNVDSFTFEQSPRKKENTQKCPDKSVSPDRDDYQGSGTHTANMEVGTSQKPSCVMASISPSQEGYSADLDSTNGNPSLKSAKLDDEPSKSKTAVEEVARLTEETSSRKSIPIRIQKIGSQTETGSVGPVTQGTCDANSTLAERSVLPASGTDSNGGTEAELEEVSSEAKNMTFAEPGADVISSGSTEQKLLLPNTEAIHEEAENNVVPTSSTEREKGSSYSHGNSQLLFPSAESIQIIRNVSAEGRNSPIRTNHRMPDLAELKISRSDSSTFQTSSKECGYVMEYQHEGGSPNCDARQGISTELAEDGSAPKDDLSHKPVAIGASGSSNTNLQSGSKAHLCSIADNSTLKSVTNENRPSESGSATKEIALLEEDTSMPKPIPARRQQASSQLEKSSSALISPEACDASKIIPDIAMRATPTPIKSAKPKISLANIAPTIQKNPCLKGENSVLLPARRAPNPPGMAISRTLAENLGASRSISGKETKLPGTLTPNKLPLGDIPSKVSQTTEPVKKTLSTMNLQQKNPEMHMSLKRKTSEAPEMDRIISNPSKRLSRNIAETSAMVVDKEVSQNPGDHDPRSVLENHHASPVDILQEIKIKQLELQGTIEDDNNIEKAESCSKELEDICNMLRKKHDEAKELLVRAVVNNNKLLMLNHPLYEEKIRMIQKFAASLTLTHRCVMKASAL